MRTFAKFATSLTLAVSLASASIASDISSVYSQIVRGNPRLDVFKYTCPGQIDSTNKGYDLTFLPNASTLTQDKINVRVYPTRCTFAEIFQNGEYVLPFDNSTPDSARTRINANLPVEARQ
ncbi:hypothetical protein J4405_02980 [Candidatus Woesearchaeota archaeon]|nr:hypothetical protein [Candidatus Woesearchaeota archaeon]